MRHLPIKGWVCDHSVVPGFGLYLHKILADDIETFEVQQFIKISILFDTVDLAVPVFINFLRDSTFSSTGFQDAETILQLGLAQQVSYHRWRSWKKAPDVLVTMLAVRLSDTVDGKESGHCLVVFLSKFVLLKEWQVAT